MENGKSWLISLSVLIVIIILGGLIAVFFLFQQNNLLQKQLLITNQDQSSVVVELTNKIDKLSATVNSINQSTTNQVITTSPAIIQQAEVKATAKPSQPSTVNTSVAQVLKTYNYKTDAYGFQVKYLDIWSVSESGDQNGGYVNFMSSKENGADTCLILFGYPSMSLVQAEKVLPALSVSGRKVDSRSKVTINGIVWNKLIIGGQIVLLTSKNSNVYGAQYSSSETKCNQILSSYKITN